MDTYLDAAVERVERRADALFTLNAMLAYRDNVIEDLAAAERPGSAGEASGASLFEAGITALTAARRILREDTAYDIQQIASLLVRDHLAPAARESDEPVVFVTGNSYFPPLRSFPACEAIYHLDAYMDHGGHSWEHLVEQIELQCANQGILLDAPEYDNSLYVVDLRRWEYIGEDLEGGDSLQDEWRSL